jgi:hypothetical protein
MNEEKVLTPQEKFGQYYNDILVQTLQQQILNSVSLQANAKVNSDILTEWQKENENLKQQMEEIASNCLGTENDLKNQIEQLKRNASSTQSAKEQQQNNEIEKLKSVIASKDDLIKNITVSKDDIINSLKSEIGRLGPLAIENEKLKQQIGILDTVKTNLIETQKIVKQKDKQIDNVIKEKDDVINGLNEQIEYLKLTPAKRKKLEAKKQGVETIETQTEEVETKIVALPEIEQPQEKVTLESLMEEPTKKDGGSF